MSNANRRNVPSTLSASVLTVRLSLRSLSQVKIIASWITRLDGDRAAELPAELQEVLADIRGIVEGARNQLLDWARKVSILVHR
jgi:hypothetical protein